MRKAFALAAIFAIAATVAPSVTNAGHCDRAGRGYQQIWVSSGQNGLPGFPNGIAGHGTLRNDLGDTGCDVENPGMYPQPARSVTGQDMPSLYNDVDTNWLTPGATHFTVWASMDNGCIPCDQPREMAWRPFYTAQWGAWRDMTTTSGADATPSNPVIWDANSEINFRNRDPFAIPDGATKIQVTAIVDNRGTPDNTTDEVTVSRTYANCTESFGPGGSGTLAPVLNQVPSTGNLCMPA